MDKYKKLLGNTLIFAIGTFGSKVLVFLMMPLYTHLLSEAEFGIADLIQQSGNLLLPLVSLGITNAVIRFGLDKAEDKRDVFSIGLICVGIGTVALLCLSPLLQLTGKLATYTWLIVLFSVMSSLRSLCSQFVRARGMVKLFAADGIFSTMTLIGFNILFLVVFKMGVWGYIAAIICSDVLSVIVLTFIARLHRFVRFRGLSRKTFREMLRYAIPLIPNTILWWITNVSDRYMLTYLIGEGSNGLYAAAYRIPSLIALAAGIFMHAWQLSAITEEKQRAQFYSRVAAMYSAVLFVLASGIILLAPWLMKLLVAPSYYEAWRYIPVLTMAMIFTCLVDFLGSVYMVNKKSVHSLVTAAVAAGTNVILNLILIPHWGAHGAAIATLVSYLVVFVVRLVDTRRYIPIRWDFARLIPGALILGAQTVICLLDLPFATVVEIVLTVGMIALYFKPIVKAAAHLLSRVKPTEEA